MRGKLGLFAGKRYQIGETWTLAQQNGQGGIPGGIAFGDGQFVIAADILLTSPDGVTWTARSKPASQSDVAFLGVGYGNGLWVAGGSKFQGFPTSLIATSNDAITWTARTHDASFAFSHVAHGGNVFVACSPYNDSILCTSADGVTWTTRNLPSAVRYGSIAYGNGLFVAVSPTATSNHIITSNDGITWTGRNVASAELFLSAVGYGNGIWVAAGSQSGSSNRIWTSPDAVTWTARGTGDGFGSEAWGVAYGDGLFVVVGAGNNGGTYITTSPDGITWTSRTNPNSSELRGVAFGNDRFVAAMFDQQGTSVPALVSA